MLDIKYYKWQKDILLKIYNNNIKKRLLAMDTGTGKTIVGLSLIQIYKPQRALIITPAILVENAWLLDNNRFRDFNLPITKLMSKNIRDIKNPGIFICSYAIFRMNHKEIKSINWDMVILDESHRIGNRGSKSAKLVMGTRTGKGFTNPLNTKRMYLMTGTMIPNREEQIYPQLCAVGLDESWTAFSSVFFYRPAANIPGWVKFNKFKKKEFYDLIEQYTDVVLKDDDVTGGRKKIFEEIRFKTSDKILTIQKDLKNKSIYKDDELEIVFDYNIEQFIKFRQISRGFIYQDNERTYQLSDTPYKMFEEFIRRAADESYIVYYAFDYERERLEKILKSKKIPCYSIHGKISSGTKEKNIAGFNKANHGVLLSQFNCGKLGLSFSNCNKMVYFSLIDDAEIMTQTQDRIMGINRGIEGENSYYYFFVSDGTIDDTIFKSVKRKTNMQDDLKGWLNDRA